jgi:hypothetical protein
LLSTKINQKYFKKIGYNKQKAHIHLYLKTGCPNHPPFRGRLVDANSCRAKSGRAKILANNSAAPGLASAWAQILNIATTKLARHPEVGSNPNAKLG